MHLSKLGSDILHMYIIPLLLHQDVLSLSVVDKTLYQQMGHLRFRCIMVPLVRPGRKSIIHFLRAKTIRTIKHLVIGGLNEYYNSIIRSNDFTAVRTVTIINPMSHFQQDTLTPLASQLTELTIIGFPMHGTLDGSINYIPTGTLNKVKMLFLQGMKCPPLYRLLSDNHGIAASLEMISYIPRQTESIMSYTIIDQDYVDNALALLSTLSNRKFLPSLRFVELVLGRTSLDESAKSARIVLLHSIWVSAMAHGGWRLHALKAAAESVSVAFVEAWECWCGSSRGPFFVTPEEAVLFSSWCGKQGRHVRWEDFVCGDVHLDVKSTGHEVQDFKLAITPNISMVHGVSVLQGRNINLYASLSAISESTRCILIQLKSFWGTIHGRLDPQQFKKVEFLRIQVTSPRNFPAVFAHPRKFRQNLNAAILVSLAVPQWQNLRALSLPAIALQRNPRDSDHDPGLTAAICGRHIPAYSLEWLAECSMLQRLQITSWLACTRCYKQLKESDIHVPASSLVSGLRNVPASVNDFLISGVFHTSARRKWELVVKGDIHNAFGKDVLINFDCLLFGL